MVHVHVYAHARNAAAHGTRDHQHVRGVPRRHGHAGRAHRVGSDRRAAHRRRDGVSHVVDRHRGGHARVERRAYGSGRRVALEPVVGADHHGPRAVGGHIQGAVDHQRAHGASLVEHAHGHADARVLGGRDGSSHEADAVEVRRFKGQRPRFGVHVLDLGQRRALERGHRDRAAHGHGPAAARARHEGHGAQLGVGGHRQAAGVD